jgi:hypothetical protein
MATARWPTYWYALWFCPGLISRKSGPNRSSSSRPVVGSPTLSTPSHISLLLHNLFNASIPASHIPSDTYHFDPDFPVPEAIQKRQKLSFPTAATVAAQAEKPEAEVEEDAEMSEGEEVVKEEDAESMNQEEEMYRQQGWWRHNVTNEPLGGEEGRIEFTIVGYAPPTFSIAEATCY